MALGVNCSMMMLILLGEVFSSGTGLSVQGREAIEDVKGSGHERTDQISATMKDITTPIATVPTVIIPTTPISTSPILNPNSNPESSTPTITVPTTSPATTNNVPVSSGVSWCVASQSASQTSLQVALDYACGYGAADCSAIQPGGSCYNPISVRSHASYAFNGYYQKNPTPSSCSFGGTAIITSTDPSTGTCQYPSASMSVSILNTTNSSGANVFGATTPHPSSAAVAKSNLLPHVCILLAMATWIVDEAIPCSLPGALRCVRYMWMWAISIWGSFL